MRTIITGGTRHTKPQYTLDAIASCPWEITEVLVGNLLGPETIAYRWAETNNIPVQLFIPEGRSTPAYLLQRNKEMVAGADALIAVWNGERDITNKILSLARSAGLEVHIYSYMKPRIE